ncbi:MAG: winged helix-turn-helix domain-containing protein [Sphingomicrobium sp.]
MLKLRDLAARSDFQVGPLRVSPSRRHVDGPAGAMHVEPLTMHVFLLLLDSDGRVVTRDELFDHCWGGVMIGDDSLNRVIGKVRRIAAEVAPGEFEVETIPRTGYRLTGPVVEPVEPTHSAAASHGAVATPSPGFSRRTAMGAMAAFVAAVGGGLWWVGRDRTHPESAALVEQGRRVLSEAWPDSDSQGVELFRRAAAIDPGNEQALGLLAIALRNVAEGAPPRETSGAVRECQTAARRALELNPREANALAALAMLQPEFGQWGNMEERLRNVLAIAPDNIHALNHLVMLMQSVGRAKDSWDLNERAAALEPHSPVHQFRRGLKYWIFGRVYEADRTIDRALQLWPRHPAVWNARLYIFAFTGRPDAALAMIDDRESRPTGFKGVSEERWRVSLRALQSRSAEDVSRATETHLKAFGGGLAVAGIMVLSALGRVDEAFDLANGWLLRKGPLVAPLWAGGGQMQINDQQWRRTMNLFTPATAAMRADPRFAELCDGIGLTEYWSSRRIGPDPMFRLV